MLNEPRNLFLERAPLKRLLAFYLRENIDVSSLYGTRVEGNLSARRIRQHFRAIAPITMHYIKRLMRNLTAQCTVDDELKRSRRMQIYSHSCSFAPITRCIFPVVSRRSLLIAVLYLYVAN